MDKYKVEIRPITGQCKCGRKPMLLYPLVLPVQVSQVYVPITMPCPLCNGTVVMVIPVVKGRVG
jgi:hypothetical protein